MKKILSTKKFLTTVMTLTLSTALLVGIADAKPHNEGNDAGKGKSVVHSVNLGKSDVKSESKQSNAQSVNKVDKQTTKAIKKEVKEEKKATKEQLNKEKVKLVQERVNAKIEAKKAKVQANAKINALKDIENHWAKDPILRMQLLGVLSGYEDGTFRPQNDVTQAEAISLIVRLFDNEDDIAIEEITDTSTTDADEETSEDEEVNEDEEDETEVVENDDELVDVPEWAKGAAKKANQMGVLNLNRFHSHVQASRAQTAVWLAKAMGLEPIYTANINFSDKLLISPEDAGYIMALVNEGFVKGTSEGKFNPNNAITRAELVVILDRIIQEPEQIEDETTQDEEQADDIIIDETTDNEDKSDEENNEADNESLDEDEADEEDSADDDN